MGTGREEPPASLRPVGSERADLQYEGFRGTTLDRRMLERLIDG